MYLLNKHVYTYRNAYIPPLHNLYSTFFSTCTVLSMVDDYTVRRVLRELRGRFSNPDAKVRKSFPEKEKDVRHY